MGNNYLPLYYVGPRVSVLPDLLADHQQADLLQLRHQGRAGASVPEPQPAPAPLHGRQEDRASKYW